MEVQKLALWLDPFVQSIQIFRWKSTEELCLMKLKSDAKFEEKLTLGPKNDMRNLVNFNASSSKSGNLHFDVLLLAISIWSFNLKSTEEWSLMALKKDLNFEEKLTFYLKIDMSKLVYLTWAVKKSENLHWKDTEELCCEKWLMVSCNF